MSKDSKLEPTYGNFKVKGVINQIEEVRTGKTGSGAEYKSLKMTINTDSSGSVRVDLFGMKEDELEIVKFQGKNVEKKKVKWAKRNSLEEGWSLSNNRAVRMGLEVKNAKTKGGLQAYASYDAIDKIVEVFEVGDSVTVEGSMRFSAYENQNGDTVTIANYNIQKIYKIADIDFEDEEFEPYSKFEQTVVIAHTEKVKNEENGQNELLVDAIIITDKNGNFVTQAFKVLVEKRKVLAQNLHKLADYSVIPLKGDIVNRALIDETGTDEDSEWGFDAQQPVIKGFERYFEILAADGTKIEEGKYKEDDFLIKDALSEEDGGDAFDNEDDGEGLDDDWLEE